MYQDVVEWVKTCDECQKQGKSRFDEPLHPTWSVMVWDKVGVDVIYMPLDGKEGYAVLARDDLSGWVEGRALEKADSLSVAKFLQLSEENRFGWRSRKHGIHGGDDAEVWNQWSFDCALSSSI